MSKIKHALIVDDSRLARDGLSALLKAVNLSVVQAGTAVAALALLKTSSIDVIFMDSRMPDCDPYEVVRSLSRQSATASIPIVICATKDAPAEREKARKSGARGFLVKPITGRVIDKILGFLEQAGPTDLSAELQQDLDSIDAENLPVLELTESQAISLQPTKEKLLPRSTTSTSSTSSASVASPVLTESVDDIMDQIRTAVEEVARQTASSLGQQAGSEAGQKAGYQAGYEAGQQVGHDAGQQAGHEAGQKAGHQAGYQAGKQAGQQAGHQAGSQAGEKRARELIDHVVQDELSQWKTTAKTEVYNLLQSRMIPLVKKLAKEIATQEAQEAAISTATETARKEADAVASKTAAELARAISKEVALEAAKNTTVEATEAFSAQWRRNLIRYTLLVSVLSASISLGMAFLLHKLPYFF